MLGMSGPSEPVCSKKDCMGRASRSILWRNPKIHDESRVKTWLSCADHESFFLEYLGAKNFPVSSEAFTPGGM
jgi:hypothetical protein